MRYFDESDITEAAALYRSEAPGEGLSLRSVARIGGIKRRARRRAVITFCGSLRFPDMSATTMKTVMRQLFGGAVSNQLLLEWATPGRKADDRVDIQKSLDVLSPTIRAAAKKLLKDFETEWAEFIALAAGKAGAGRKEAGQGRKAMRKAAVPKAAPKASAGRAAPSARADRQEDVQLPLFDLA